MSTQRYNLEAFLGEDHGLTEDQINDLLTEATEISARYPDADEQAERDAALTAAYRLVAEDAGSVVADLATARMNARAAEVVALAGLQQTAVTLIERGEATESGFARQAGVDRMTVRKWLGK